MKRIIFIFGLIVFGLFEGVNEVYGDIYTKITSVAALNNGDEVIIATGSSSPGTGVTGGVVQNSTSTKKDATVSTTTSDWMKFTVTTTTNGWYLINSSSQYIGKPTDNTFYLTTSSSCYGVCSVNSNGVLCCNSRYLQKNGSYYRMYALNNNYTPFYVWKVSTSYTITAQSNNVSYGTVSLSGNVITAISNDGYRICELTPYTIISGTATVARGVGVNANKFTITSLSNCTIQINFEVIPVNPSLFHETFGNNPNSAIVWSDTASHKSGVICNKTNILYEISNFKQSKNNTGYELSGLIQTTKGTDAYIIIGPLDVSLYTDLILTYYWKAGSIKETYSTKLFYKTIIDDDFEEIDGTGDGATTFILRSYNLPNNAISTNLFLKITWNTSNAQSIIDEIDLQGALNEELDNTTIMVWNPSYIKLDITDGNLISIDGNDYTSLPEKETDGTYKIFVNLSDRSCTDLKIKVKNSTTNHEYLNVFKIPIFISSNMNNTEMEHVIGIDSMFCDVVTLENSKLNLTNNLQNRDVMIYPNSTLKIPNGTTYTVNSLTLRRDNNDVPQLLYNGQLNIENGMFFEMRTDAEDWRWLSLPDSIRLKEISGNSETLLKYYDGETRAQNGKGGWTLLENDTTSGLGVIFGIDLDNNDKRTYTFELDTNILSQEKTKKTINVKGFQHDEKPINDLGWNLVGNPYMTTYIIGDEFDGVLQTDSLIKEMNGDQWTGKWVPSGNKTNLRYIVIPSWDTQEEIDAGGYKQVCLQNGYSIKPFTSFFVQVNNDGELIFNNQHKASAPSRMKLNTNKEVFLQINVGNIKTGCYISNKFTDEYEIGDDMESLYSTYQFINNYKLLYSAINDSIIERGIQIHGSGKVSLDDKTDISGFSEISVFYNNTWFNLLAGDQPNVQGDFILFAKRIANDVPTDIEMITNDNIEKFIYKANMYIKKNNHIYNILGGCIK